MHGLSFNQPVTVDRQKVRRGERETQEGTRRLMETRRRMTRSGRADGMLQEMNGTL